MICAKHIKIHIKFELRFGHFQNSNHAALMGVGFNLFGIFYHFCTSGDTVLSLQ